MAKASSDNTDTFSVEEDVDRWEWARRGGKQYYDVEGFFANWQEFNEWQKKPLQADWTFIVDNDFALQTFKQISHPKVLLQLPTLSQLCQPCSNLDILSKSFELVTSLSEVRKTSELCELCRMFCRCFEHSGTSDQEKIKIFRVGSMLRMDKNDLPILRICADPRSKAALPNVQIGFPILPEVKSQTQIELLREWLQECDTHHKCRSMPNRLPTRLLDVWDHGDFNSLRLHYTTQDDQGEYIALSHCWGKLRPEEKEKFCTFRHNVSARREKIDVDDLPKTFQDAIMITRALDKRFLWIDSLCIVQDDAKDWEVESKLMEEVFSSAYCTIAASSARDSTEGFLRPRAATQCIKIPNASEDPVYICEPIDDFHHDVEEGELSRRGWVLQERALSCRTIHFTTTQTYWECGDGVRCETLTKLDNPRARFLSDPEFPKSILPHSEKNRVGLFEFLFERYSKLALTNSADRSVAISGLEKRLLSTFNTTGGYGVFQCYLHRSLLWQRFGDRRMKRIPYPKVPSWSWMAYEGEISYRNISFEKVEWSDAVQCSSSLELTTLVNDFSLSNVDELRDKLILDEEDKTDIQKLKCVVIGRARSVLGQNHEQEHYILVVKPSCSEEPCRTYERVGVSFVQKGHISFEGEKVRVRII